MLTQLRTATVLLLLLTFVTGVLYPLVLTGISQAFFPEQANGSLLKREGQLVGSTLIGQAFTDPKYFWSRPSATTPPYNAGASTGSNLGPANPALVTALEARLTALKTSDPTNSLPVPVDLVTTSGSGLDPHLSPAAAAYQVRRVARVRGVPEAQVRELIAQATEGRQFGVFGEPRVHVLNLNLALDNLTNP